MKKGELKIVNQNSTTAEIYIYGIIGRYFDIDVNLLVPRLEILKNRGIKNLTFYVHSEGGQVDSGIALFQYLERSGFNCTWVIDGIAASISFMIMLHKGSIIQAARYSKAMIHRVGGVVEGNADTVRNHAQQMENWETDLIDILATRTGMTVDNIKEKWFDGQNHWLTAKELEDLGLATIIDLREGIEPAPSNLTTTEAYNYYNRIFNLKTEANMKNSGRFVAILSTLPGFKAMEDADEDAIYNSVRDVVARCVKADSDLKAKELELENLKKVIDGQKDTHIKNLIDQAIKDKRFGEDLRETYTNLAKGDLEGTTKIINSLGGVPNIKSALGTSAADDKRKDWNWDKYQKEDPSALAKIKQDEPEKFKSLYKDKYGKEPKIEKQ